jgi:hypothetical protein
MSCDFFLWDVKDRVFVPPLPHDLADLKARIIAAVKNIDAPMLTRLWQELEYRIYEGALKSFQPNNEKTNLSFQNYFYFST